MQTKSYWCVRLVWFVVTSQILTSWTCLVGLPSSLLLLGRDLDDDQFGVSLGGESGALRWEAVPVVMHRTWILAIWWPWKLGEQSEGCPNIQLRVAGTAQHLLSKVGDHKTLYSRA